MRQKKQYKGNGIEMQAKFIVISMPDGSEWLVPSSVIAENRAKAYAEILEGNFEKAYKETLEAFGEDEFQMLDWAANNMDWDDVKNVAVRLERKVKEPVDYDEGWVNGPKEIVGDSYLFSTFSRAEFRSDFLESDFVKFYKSIPQETLEVLLKLLGFSEVGLNDTLDKKKRANNN